MKFDLRTRQSTDALARVWKTCGQRLGIVRQPSLLIGFLFLLSTSPRPYASTFPIDRALEVKVHANKSHLRLNEEITFKFEIKNVSNRVVRFIRFGSPFGAQWVRFEIDSREVEWESLFDKNLGVAIDEGNVVTLKPGKIFRAVRKGTLEFEGSDRAFLNMFDSGIALRCGRHYRIRGKFVARKDYTGKLNVIVGDVFSKPIDLFIECAGGRKGVGGRK